MIVVTGASGFIGRRLVPALLAERPGAKLRCLVKENDDAFGRQGTDFLRSILDGTALVPAELLSGRGLAGLHGPELVFHLAANTHTWESDHRCNDLGTRNLLRALEPLGPRTHLIFTSTTAVMDNRRDLPRPLGAETRVQGPPLSPYGRTKWQAEEFLRGEARRLGFRLSIARLCTVYGPGYRPNTFFDVLLREVARRSVVSRLNWPGLTSFIHVDDVVRCLLSLAGDPPEPGKPRTYLLATESRTLQDAARLVYRELGLPYRELRVPGAVWAMFRHLHGAGRLGARCLPASLFHFLWRFNLVANPVFHCETEPMWQWFPELKPRCLADSIRHVVGQASSLSPTSAELRCGWQASEAGTRHEAEILHAEYGDRLEACPTPRGTHAD